VSCHVIHFAFYSAVPVVGGSCHILFFVSISYSVCWAGENTQTFYVRDNGMDVAIQNAVDSIVSCLRSEDGYCTTPPDEAPSMKRMGML
jgi:hypothetical protein